MAGVTGTEVLYKRESKLGLTTLTFRKRRYLFPSVAHQGDHVLSASTGDLVSRGKCVMLDVGLFCPHCAGAITATLSGSRSKLVVSKVKGREHRCLEEGREHKCLKTGSLAPQTEARSDSSRIDTRQGQWHKSVERGETRTKMPAALAEETRLEIGFGSLDRHGLTCRSPDKHRRAEKLSSSDYESLDRDIHMDSWSSYDNNTATFDSVTRSGSLTAPSRTDDAYCSMTSSQHSATQDSLQKMSNLSPKYSSLPRNVRLPVSAPTVSEEKLILDTMHVETSDKNDSVLVDELLSDDVIDEEYQNLMNASAAKEMNGVGHMTDGEKSHDSEQMICLPSDEGRNEDSSSQRSTSPETFVDDVLENIESEIYPGDATLPRVFALHRDGSLRKHSSKRKQKLQSQVTRLGTENGEDPSKRNTSSLKRRELHELIKAFYKSSQKNKLAAQEDTDFSHETVFEEVVEALTDLEGGFTTDWTSDYDSDNKSGSPSSAGAERAKFLLGDEREGSYREIADGYKIRTKTATSSCECIPDDRSRDLDSSTERIPSSVATPSELSAGSAEGYGSSSECSLYGQAESARDETRLFEELIQNTKSLTEDLLVMREDHNTPKMGSLQETDEQVRFVPPDKRRSPVTDRLIQEDEVFTVSDQSTVCQSLAPNKQSANKSHAHIDVIRNIGPIPKIVVPDEHFEELDAQSYTKTAVRLTTRSENSDDDDDDGVGDGDDLDVSLENLLVTNAIHCSTSDLDEPYSAELRYVSGLKISRDPHEDEDRSSSDAHLGSRLTEVDEFVPETDEPQREVLQQSFDDVSCTSLPTDSCKVMIGKQGHVTGAGLDGSEGQVAPSVDQNELAARDKGAMSDLNADARNKCLVSKDLMKYVQSQTCKTYQSKEHNTRLDTCLDDTCQTCEFQPKAPNEFVKKEEVITQEMTLVFVWPKKMNIGRELTPKVATSKAKEPFRSIHLRRVMRVSDFDVDVVEGPVVETVEYRKDGPMRKSIVQRPDESSPNKDAQKSEDGDSKSDLEQTEQPKETKEWLENVVQHEESRARARSGSSPEDKHVETDDGEPESSRREPDDYGDDDGGGLAELERSHYDVVSESFTMPSMDMTTSQRSEELFDLSSAASRELLLETENELAHLYSDHQQTVDAIYEQAERASLCEEDVSTGVADLEELPELMEKNEELASMRADLEMVTEDDQSRESASIPGKEANVRLIDQTERNVYFVNIGKYFAGRSEDGADVVDGGQKTMEDQSMEDQGREDQSVEDQGREDQSVEDQSVEDQSVEDQSVEDPSRESTCPRCENFFVVDEVEQSAYGSEIGELRASGSPSDRRRRHPVPCERCLRLEREIRIKLAELSKLIEEIGRRRRLRERESSDDLDTLSEETAENIRILERSIAMLNDVDNEAAANGDDGRVPRDAVTSERRRSRRKAPVSYSTKVIKRRKPKHVAKLREIFGGGALPADEADEKNGQLSDSRSTNRDAALLSRDLQLAAAGTSTDQAPPSGDRPTAADVYSSSTKSGADSKRAAPDDSDSPTKSALVMSSSPSDYRTQLETFAENLAKYIIFRAKLFIVLENPATRIPYLKNELAPAASRNREGTDDNCEGGPSEGRHLRSDINGR